MLALTLLAAVLPAVEAAPSPPAHPLTLEISFDPPVEQIRPDRTDRPTRVTVKATCRSGSAAALPVPGAEVRVTLDAPERRALLTTDFPIVEGTRLLELSGRTDSDGRLTFDYVFPIRGRYRLTAATVSGDGSTTIKPLEIDVAENAEEWAYLFLLLGGLFALGLAAGFVFGRSHRAARAAAVAGPAAAVLAIFAVGMPGGAPAHGHGDEGHDDGPVKSRTVARGPLTLEYALELPADRDRPRVGEPAAFNLALRSSGSAAAAEFEVTIVNAEENEPVFAAVLRAGADGRARFAYQFWDGADHELRVTARSGDAAVGLSTASDATVGSGEPVMIPVEAIEPPTPVVIKSLTLMLLVCAAGLALGFTLGARG